MIEEVWIANHTHHDIGFNDYQDVCLRQHGEFVEQALDLIEATADREPQNRYRWVCEVTGPLLRWLRGAGRGQAERLRHWESEGAVEIAAMQYNTTPLLSPEQMRRSLYPVRALREEYGLRVDTAMQDDVNGIAWLFADLLPSIGVDFLTLAINQSRGGAPRPFPGAFWWEGPAGSRTLAWNGFHYLFGRSQAKLGDWRYARAHLGHYLDLLQTGGDFEYAELYCESTHAMRVDNGPPDAAFADFVRDWNDAGTGPLLRMVTPRQWRDRLLQRYRDALEVRRGDWTDWWADGAGSSAYETGVNRATHDILESAETIAAWLRAAGRPQESRELVDRLWESMNLYDEHTWGAFSAIDAPHSLFTRSQWNRKANFAYRASMGAHDVLTRQTRSLAGTVATRLTPGRFNLGDLPDAEAFPPNPGQLLVLNTLPYERQVLVPVPEYRAGGAPDGMLECFFPRDVPWGGQPRQDSRAVRARVPAHGWVLVDPEEPQDFDDLIAEGSRIENEYYRVQIDPDSGEITSWFDKGAGTELAAELDEGGFGALIHEAVDSPKGRDALYQQDFASWDFGYWQDRSSVPFVRHGITGVRVERARIEAGVAEIVLVARLSGTRSVRRSVALPSGRRELRVDWRIDKIPSTEPESMYVLFGSTLPAEHRADLNGVPVDPRSSSRGGDQLDGSVEYFTPVRRWASVGAERRMVVCPLEAPLVQFGGITTNRFDDVPEIEPRAGIVSWALNNHWMVNFRAEQEGIIDLRHRLTDTDGGDTAAARWAEEVMVAPIVLRDHEATGHTSGSFVTGLGGGLQHGRPDGVEVTLMPATQGTNLLLRLRNLTPDELTITVPPGGAEVDALECPVDPGAADRLPPYACRNWLVQSAGQAAR